jgi:hypothetical protein
VAEQNPLYILSMQQPNKHDISIQLIGIVLVLLMFRPQIIMYLFALNKLAQL